MQITPDHSTMVHRRRRGGRQTISNPITEIRSYPLLIDVHRNVKSIVATHGNSRGGIEKITN